MTFMTALLIKLLLATMWLAATMAIFTVEATQGPLRWRGWPFDYSIAWLTLLAAIYNGVRALSLWHSLRRRRMAQLEEAMEARRRFARNRPRVEEPPNPDFQFTDSNQESGNRNQESGNREQESGNRNQEPGIPGP